jgi:acyl dehydratase
MAQTTVDIDAVETDSGTERFAKITDEALESLRSLIGVPIEDTVEPWCYEATRDNLRHYAHGIGDDNPLWCDPEYAAGTRYGTLVAPPSFAFALSRILSGYVGGLPGVHAMWAGADLTWHRAIERDTKIRTSAYLKDLVEHDTRFAGRAFQQIYHVELTDEAGNALVSGDSWCFRTERDAARERGSKYAEQKAAGKTVYTQDELSEVYDLYEAEVVRGAEPRYGEDVEVGEQLPVMGKGPMTVTGFIAFAQGWGGLYIRANKLAYKLIKKHPGLGIPNALGVLDVPERVHWEEELALDVGTPGAYDYGPERCSWLTQHLTNWMGDDGFLRHHTAQIRHHNVVGDVVRISGSVVEKRVDEQGRHLVTIDQVAHNQHGHVSATGRGTVELPARS